MLFFHYLSHVCYFSPQCCKTFGISQYHVFIYLVDYWILLGIRWWSRFSPRFSSALLVCPLSISLLLIVDISFNKQFICDSLIFWLFNSYFSSILFDPVYMLRRLCIIFLGFDVVFVVFCVALACIIGIAVCCCLPCIIAILYAVADQVCWISLSRCVLVFKIL